MTCQDEVSMDMLLVQVSHFHRARAFELFEKIGLYRGQPPVLYALWQQEGLTHKELAERLNNTPATISRMLQRMEKSGFIRREADLNDQRVSRVYLTEAGRAVRAQVDLIHDRMQNETFAGFDAGELETLRGYLLRLKRNLAEARAKDS